MTRVVHCKREKYDVYIGRPSIWGNPAQMKSEKDRSKAIEVFRLLMAFRLSAEYRGYGEIPRPKSVPEDADCNWWKVRLQELKGKTLGCWCKPKACHGDVLAELADKT